MIEAQGLSHRYGDVQALEAVSLTVAQGELLGVAGPDGVGKSTLLGLLTGVRKRQHGTVRTLGGDIDRPAHRQQVSQRLAYMPQGLGKNLYPGLTVSENLAFFSGLFPDGAKNRRPRIERLLHEVGLAPFKNRPAAKLSGGMKQKLGLCCALMNDPDLLVLDEPTTGVDPLSRRQFWSLIEGIRAAKPQMTVIVATASMDEAAQFDRLIVMDGGRILADAAPDALLRQTGTAHLDDAFIALLPEAQKVGYRPLQLGALPDKDAGIAIEAKHLTRRFGSFVAVRDVSFRIRRGEIFGFLGSNGCGKTTTMKMLTGLLPASEGQAWLFGKPVESGSLQVKRDVGFMSQSFSLYPELTVGENLILHARLFLMSEADCIRRTQEVLRQFSLSRYRDSRAASLPTGVRQRLSLGVAMIHRPQMLILDEPTSGVDPVSRNAFWQLLVRLSREEGVTIFISTHYMNEAMLCDRISLMHAGSVLAKGQPQALIDKAGTDTLEDAFIHYMPAQAETDNTAAAPLLSAKRVQRNRRPAPFRLTRMLAYSRSELQDLLRDPVRLLFALLGTLILMVVLGFGLNSDVEEIPFAVIDHDRSAASLAYRDNLLGSQFFSGGQLIEPPANADSVLRHGDVSLVMEFPPGFGRGVYAGDQPEVGAWIDAAMPGRAESVGTYVEAMHAQYLQSLAGTESTSLYALHTRFRYNQTIRSINAMVPAIIPMLLMMITAILAALSVVREKELGSINNFYATPVTRMEFLLGKQLPYLLLGFINFVLLVVLAVGFFRVPLVGSFPLLAVSALLYLFCASGLGLLMSTFTNTQIAAIFGTMLATLIPAAQYGGLTHPVASMEGLSKLIAQVYPTSHFVDICRGVFAKSMGLSALWPSLVPMALFGVAVLILCRWRLQEQQR
ncbi:ribosome-associated ATPase/putative transporter RbbA [Granulosicoccaceae sp. 1_MG-2023]|nr:ribosome-associated ATPase/putative transporter RbbA [Granulosicoccaceae sp. 1_MG-2023]